MAGAPEGASWKEHMKRAIRLLLDCEAVFLLRGWADSPGAALEAGIARALGITRYYEDPADLGRAGRGADGGEA